jgi:hypothetical protein
MLPPSERPTLPRYKTQIRHDSTTEVYAMSKQKIQIRLNFVMTRLNTLYDKLSRVGRMLTTFSASCARRLVDLEDRSSWLPAVIMAVNSSKSILPSASCI